TGDAPEEFGVVVGAEDRATTRRGGRLIDSSRTERLVHQHCHHYDRDEGQQICHVAHLLPTRVAPRVVRAQRGPLGKRPPAAGQCSVLASVVSDASSCMTSDSRKRRCPPGVRSAPRRPACAQRVTVLGSTWNRAATCPGVSKVSWPPTVIALIANLSVLRQSLINWRHRRTRTPRYSNHLQRVKAK